MPRPSGTRRTVYAWNLAGLILLAVNLRPAITGVSPLIARIQTSYHLSSLSTSALATLPVLCMGVFAALAPALGRRYGTEAAITAALVLTTVGIVLRVLSSALALFAGTVLAGAGLAIGNALLPAVVKRHFPTQVGPMTGAAMMVLAASAAIAAAIASQVADQRPLALVLVQ